MIKLQNVSLRFGEREVFRDFSASIPLSGVTAVSGPSGAGKTTLFRLILGLQKPDFGTVSGLEGKRPAVVFQEDRLLPWTDALGNVSLVSDEKRAAEALAAVGLSGSERLLPDQLSGGMKRRVALARALAYGGDLLLLDEPFTGLDDESKRAAAEAIRRAGLPALIITHDASEAALLGALETIRLV